ncbi:hypothetical protein CCHL11_03124 [Colletotrichum chlorophyti]|uniref:Uncharacterized protein n=1 Tax=Colletotrichum chlorophyti TaxID=708187 RepID=A0A1Q8RGM3_9PEZI|nr:hypothetical protein CCHL11_03124 [Colletotrichum chlorophyti]
MDRPEINPTLATTGNPTIPSGSAPDSAPDCQPINDPIPLSLNQLKAGEVIHRVHDNADALLHNMQQLLQARSSTEEDKRYIASGTALNHHNLVSSQRISQRIVTDMAELVRLSSSIAERDRKSKRSKTLRRRPTKSQSSVCNPKTSLCKEAEGRALRA